MLDGRGHDVNRGVSLGCELVRISAILGVVGLDKVLIPRRRRIDEPGRARNRAFGRFASQLRQLRRVKAVAANETNRIGDAKLPALGHDASRFFGQRGNHNGLWIQSLDLGQLRGKVSIALLERFRG